MAIVHVFTASATRRVMSRLTIAAWCGVAATAATRAFAGATCTGVEPPGVTSTCDGLVESLSVRLGVVVGMVALLAMVMGSALLRTADELAERREELRRSHSAGPRPAGPLASRVDATTTGGEGR
jgi:hypothetical protein